MTFHEGVTGQKGSTRNEKMGQFDPEINMRKFYDHVPLKMGVLPRA
jgi:hypothetical protein